jgi:bifunctional non-homologous end joining protein LigD
MVSRWSSSSKPTTRRMTETPGTMPELVKPQLATLASRPPSGGGWSYEIKFDGYRILARIEDGITRLFTRNGHDWTARLPALRDALAEMPVASAWLDGEAVVLDKDGRPDFNALQNAFDTRSTAEITLFAFDLLWINGTDIREQPLLARRRLLEKVMTDSDSPLLRFSEDFAHDPTVLLASARNLRLEGIIGKRADGPYRSGRSTDWIKLKGNLRQEFAVGGITRLKGVKAGVRALMLGVFEVDGSLRYVGTVQPSLSQRQTVAFRKRIEALERDAAPFRNAPAPDRELDYLWLEPSIVAEVRFLEWTRSGGLRHAVFEGFRQDKQAGEVVAEMPVEPESKARPARKKLL